MRARNKLIRLLFMRSQHTRGACVMSVPPFHTSPSTSTSTPASASASASAPRAMSSTAEAREEAREFFGWRADAACAGMPPQVVFARRPADAAPALRACARCPVTRQCEETVDPAHTWFDGVSAGRLWHNGRPVDLNRGARARARRTRPLDDAGATTPGSDTGTAAA
ncbi:WhiB family transcriptional regulator [Streptomyces sp. NPDC051310]|uniref:WhiB family transcriptional regulator n=1 Tax=Streptomyces sp. NPDC051310 TaxID=3365649 RepID=UPI0037B66551